MGFSQGLRSEKMGLGILLCQRVHPCDSEMFVQITPNYMGEKCGLAVDQPGVFNPVLLPAGTMETARSPKFPGNPNDHSPCSSDPGVTRQAEVDEELVAWLGPRV